MITQPELVLLSAIVVAGFIQLAKMFIPLLNGWGALAGNAVVSAVALFAIFRFELTWNVLAIYLLIGLTAAGIHGTTTKVSDHPHPHENPTPSGTPAQNYGRMVD